jgi:transposase
MERIREIIRLHESEFSQRKISQALNVSRPVVAQYLKAFCSKNLKYADIVNMPDDELLELLSNKKTAFSKLRYQKMATFFPDFGVRLKQKGQTLHNLWKEYIAQHPDGYSYSQFCYYYRIWRETNIMSMHIDYKAGDKMLVDFTGQKLKIVDPITNRPRSVEVFVAILGASQLTYVEAVATQCKEDWIKANTNALKYFKGVPQAIVPDCLKSGVTKFDKYEPDVNPEYADFAQHYGTVILPTRPGRPKDKALVENAVKIIYTRIFIPLQHKIFYSIEELNKAIIKLLEKHNQTPFQRLKISRQQLFEKIEKACLKPLPAEDYEPKKFCNLKVQFNYHIYLSEDKHYYSVPYRYVRKKVTVIYTSLRVEIFYRNIRIASHRRDRREGKYTTLPEHMPPNHRYYANSTPEQILEWSQKVGEGTQTFISELLERKQCPEQAYKSCLGVLSLGKKYGKDRLESACQRAIQFRYYSYQAIKNILEHGLDRIKDDTRSLTKLPEHENLRGQEYYS